MAKAEPRIDEYTAKLVYRGRWAVPGHFVRILLPTAYAWANANTVNRRDGAILLCFRFLHTFVILDSSFTQ